MLKDTGAKAGRPDFVAAVRAAGVGVMVEEVVDQVGGEQRPLVPGVAWLSASERGVCWVESALGGLTMSEEGGLEEVEESLRAEASCSWRRATAACRASIWPCWASTCICKR